MLSFLLICLTTAAQAFIPKGMLILHKAAENSGSGTYVIEQEVQFPSSPESFVLKETWVIESENQMTLFVSGTKEFKDSVHWQVSYSGGQKTSVFGSKKQTSKITEDFLERYFHFRSSENFANLLISMKVVPASILNRRIPKTVKDVENQPESFIRLSRSGGVINYAFGNPANPDEPEKSPGFWFEQDQFVLRKLRLSSGVEVQAERFSPYPRGLMYPRKRNIHWENSQVQIQTLSVTAKSAAHPSLSAASRIDGLDATPAKASVIEFYNRFR